MRLEELAHDDLMIVMEHHRDREDYMLTVLSGYITGAPVGSTRTHEAYERAVGRIAQHLDTMLPSDYAKATAEYSEYLSDAYVSPRARASLGALKESARLAHAVAFRVVHRLGWDLDRHLRAVVPDDSRVLGIYPELRERLTGRDLLLPVADDVHPGHGWVSYRNHDLHLHPGMRRGYSSRMNYGLLHLLWAQRASGMRVAVALDHYRIAPRGEVPQYFEFDRWFGRPLSMDQLDERTAVGPTVHGRLRPLGPMPSEREGLLTEFRWTYQDGQKGFEVEELPSPDSLEEGPVVCRFAHAIRDVSTKRFVHLDGAITIYSLGSYQQRYSQALNHHQDKVWADSKVKLFRIDADENQRIDEDDWTKILNTFFRGNELVLEYTSGKSFFDIYQEEYGHDYPYLDRTP